MGMADPSKTIIDSSQRHNLQIKLLINWKNEFDASKTQMKPDQFEEDMKRLLKKLIEKLRK